MPDIRLTLSDEMLAEVDQARVLVPRVAWIRETIEHRLRDARELRVPEPKPSKAPPRATGGLIPEEGRRLPPPLVVTSKTDHAWVGTRPTCMRSGCPVPKDKEAHL